MKLSLRLRTSHGDLTAGAALVDAVGYLPEEPPANVVAAIREMACR